MTIKNAQLILREFCITPSLWLDMSQANQHIAIVTMLRRLEGVKELLPVFYLAAKQMQAANR